MNMLQRSVLSDFKDENIYQEIVALAIIGKIITTLDSCRLASSSDV
jgi:hypothetical protein